MANYSWTHSVAICSLRKSCFLFDWITVLIWVLFNFSRTRIQLEGLEDSHLLEDEEDDTLRDKQGCPAYVSPEILERAQSGYSGKASDQWSSGVMLYTMLVGRYPFQESEPTKLFEKIKLGNFSIPSIASAKAKCLIRNLLRREAVDRLTADEVLQHPWLKISYSSFNNTRMTSSRDYINDHLVPCLWYMKRNKIPCTHCTAIHF